MALCYGKTNEVSYEHSPVSLRPHETKKGKHMPYINLKLVGKLTKKQKETIAREFSETLLRVAGKPKESTYIVIDEVEGKNWAKGDKFYG